MPTTRRVARHVQISDDPNGDDVLIPVDTYKRPPAGAAREDEATLPKLRFLVVDDTAELRELMARMIVRAGHVAEEAADGVEATEALAAHRYDVMLLDLSMPRMSGEDVVRWLHANPDRAEGMRTVVVTAWGGVISDLTAQSADRATGGRRGSNGQGR